MRFTVLGSPVPKGRPRLGRRGVYTPEKTAVYEELVRLSYLEQCRGEKPFENAVAVDIALYMPIPESTGKKQRRLMEEGQIRPAKRPDADNCVKSITDALNGLAYKDDSLIVDISARKYYSGEPRAVIKICSAETGETFKDMR